MTTRVPHRCPKCGRHVPIKSDRVIAVVTASKHPLTTIEVAAALRASATDISSRLTKLANRGLVSREFRVSHSHGAAHRYAVWSASTEIAQGE